MSLGNPGHSPVVMRRDGGQRRVLDDEAVVFGHAVQAHLAERRGDDFHVAAAGAGDLDVTAGYRRDYAPAAGFDVVAVETSAGRRAAAPAP